VNTALKHCGSELSAMSIYMCHLMCKSASSDLAVMHCRYMSGASTNPDAHVVAYAAAQVKKGLEIAKKLGAENFGNCVH